MVEVRNLVKTYDGFTALNGLNLSVPRGAVYGLLGKNGAGKSSTIRHIAGIYRQDSGTVTVNGEPVFENPGVKEKIAYIPDEIFYYTQATAEDMKQLYSSIYPHFSTERYHRLGKELGIGGKRPIRKLSKGMQKQEAFRLALSCCPELVLLDEPVDGLDPVMRRELWGILLAEVAERGTTVLLSSHNLRELEDVCDHVGIMDQGKMLLEHSLEELQSSVVKVQAVFKEGAVLPQGQNILSVTASGRLQQIVLRGTAADAQAIIAPLNPVYMDVLPLTLEEIFIYELGGAEHEIKNTLLQ